MKQHFVFAKIEQHIVYMKINSYIHSVPESISKDG